MAVLSLRVTALSWGSQRFRAEGEIVVEGGYEMNDRDMIRFILFPTFISFQNTLVRGLGNSPPPVIGTV